MGPGSLLSPGRKPPVGKEIPVISPVLTVRPVQIGAPPWRSMRPVDKQKVRQVYSDRHETCTLLFQLFEIYNFEDYGVQSLQGSAASRHIGLSYAFNLMAELDFVAELFTTRSRMELSYYCGPVARNSCWAILKNGANRGVLPL